MADLNMSLFNISNAFVDRCSYPFNSGLDMACFIEMVCHNFSEYVIYLAWLCVIIPLLVHFGLILVFYFERRENRLGGTLFSVKWLNKWFCIGWESYRDFEVFVLRELLLFMALIGGCLLYILGVFA